jgi:hypothetical protein
MSVLFLLFLMKTPCYCCCRFWINKEMVFVVALCLAGLVCMGEAQNCDSWLNDSWPVQDCSDYGCSCGKAGLWLTC